MADSISFIQLFLKSCSKDDLTPYFSQNLFFFLTKSSFGVIDRGYRSIIGKIRSYLLKFNDCKHAKHQLPSCIRACANMTSPQGSQILTHQTRLDSCFLQTQRATFNEAPQTLIQMKLTGPKGQLVLTFAYNKLQLSLTDRKQHLCALSNIVPFGYNKLQLLLTKNSLSVISQMLWYLATTNYSSY